jgi:hypothetical protein
MTDVWFVVAGWGLILGGLAVYAATLPRRLAAARRALREAPAAEATLREDETLGGRG